MSTQNTLRQEVEAFADLYLEGWLIVQHYWRRYLSLSVRLLKIYVGFVLWLLFGLAVGTVSELILAGSRTTVGFVAILLLPLAAAYIRRQRGTSWPVEPED